MYNFAPIDCRCVQVYLDISALHTPDFFVIGRTSAAWVECKTEEQLLKLASTQPNRFHFDEADKIWRCPPGETHAAQFGLGYIVKSSAGIDWVYQRNVLFLEDFLRAESLEISAEMTDYLRSRAAATPGRALSEFLEETSRNGLSGDCIYIAIVTDQIYVDLRAAPLAEPERVRVYFDEASARLYRDTGRHISLFLPSAQSSLSASSLLNWDGKLWEIVNRGESSAWLKDEAGSVISLSEQTLSNLLSQGSAQVVSAPSLASETDSKSAKELLARASAADLAEANRRYAILTAYRAGGWNQELGVTMRTIQRWEADVRQAEAVYQCGYAGLLPRTKQSGNRTPRLPEETRKLMEEYISKEYEEERQPTRFAVWSKLLRDCESRGLSAPSYRAFCQFVVRRPRYEQIKKRQGRRAAYQAKEFFYELSDQTPRHGDRPFEIANIDHSELDIELVIIDEAQHLTKISSGRRLQEQMDVLKSLANQTGSLLVLIGTYELLTFQGLSGQLSRRSVSVHFPRYGSGAEDLKAFQSVLYGFQRRLPVMEEPDLLKNWEYCYVRSIGCVGILKDWLVRALGASIVEGGRTVSMRHLEEMALSVWQCEQIARETLAGEERLTEKPGSMSRLSEMLGLVLQRMAAPADVDDSPVEAGDVMAEKKVEKPRSKRRVGQRKPKRDPLA